MAAAVAAAGMATATERIVTLAVKNMYCSACPYIVKQSLAKIGGVGNVAVSYEKKTATVTYDDHKTNVAALIGATTILRDRSPIPKRPNRRQHERTA
jgi:mercuric ion binding protein